MSIQSILYFPLPFQIISEILEDLWLYRMHTDWHIMCPVGRQKYCKFSSSAVRETLLPTAKILTS